MSWLADGKSDQTAWQTQVLISFKTWPWMNETLVGLQKEKQRDKESERVGNPPSHPPPLWSNPTAPFIWLIFTPEEFFSTPFYTHTHTHTLYSTRDCRPLTLYPFQTRTSYYFTHKTRPVVFDTLKCSVVTSAWLIRCLPTDTIFQSRFSN